jgi:hypothetical protein
MNTQQGVKAMLRAIPFVSVLSLATPLWAQTIYTAGPNTGPTPQAFGQVVRTPSGKYELDFRAGADGLGMRVTVENEVYAPHPAPVAAIRISDLIITGDEPGALTGLAATPLLHGSKSGNLGAGHVAVTFTIISSRGVSNPSAVRNIPEFPVNTAVSTGPIEVPVNEPITFGVSMTIGASGTGTLDASKSLLFNREAVFDLEPGFTANSVSWGLVNNRLVPEPASIWLLAGMGALMLGRRRGRA